jgi:catechol 2,3-dioxygenase-like lactoylglutathione lyase family enzyme
MPLSNGCHHVTIVTEDMDRFIAFYCSVFEAELKLDMDEGPLRHAMIDLGAGFCLHPFAFKEGNPQGKGEAEQFGRGHIDHIAIQFDDRRAFETVRKRLVETGATEGRLADFGVVHVVEFTDPDGMRCEIAMWAAGEPLTFPDRRLEPFDPKAAE